MTTSTHNRFYISSEDGNALIRLMQLVSPALPIGAYSFSQGLEYATSVGWVNDESTAKSWIMGLLKYSLGRLDIPVFSRLYMAWQTKNYEKACFWNQYLYACRESSEIQAEDTHMGRALARLLVDMKIEDAQAWIEESSTCLATLFSLAAVKWRISLYNAAMGYLWSWTENQVLAAIKLVPLGQTAGQIILSHATELIPEVVDQGLVLEEGQIGNLMTSAAIGSALHETMYTRLFQS